MGSGLVPVGAGVVMGWVGLGLRGRRHDDIPCGQYISNNLQTYAKQLVAGFASFYLFCCINHSMQMCCCMFNVIIFILSSSAFCCKHSTAVNLFKIAVGKFIPLFGIFILFCIDSQVPFPIFTKAMLFNILVLILCRWLVLTPHISLIKDKISLLYQFCCMFKCSVIQFDCHRSNLLFQSQSKRSLLVFTIPSIGRKCCTVKYLYYLIYYYYEKIYFLSRRCCAWDQRLSKAIQAVEKLLQTQGLGRFLFLLIEFL